MSQPVLPAAHDANHHHGDEEHQPCRRGADDERQLLLHTGLVLGWHEGKREQVTVAQDVPSLTKSWKSEDSPEHRLCLIPGMALVWDTQDSLWLGDVSQKEGWRELFLLGGRFSPVEACCALSLAPGPENWLGLFYLAAQI